jgi:hypothetical protein
MSKESQVQEAINKKREFNSGEYNGKLLKSRGMVKGFSHNAPLALTVNKEIFDLKYKHINDYTKMHTLVALSFGKEDEFNKIQKDIYGFSNYISMQKFFNELQNLNDNNVNESEVSPFTREFIDKLNGVSSVMANDSLLSVSDFRGILQEDRYVNQENLRDQLLTESQMKDRGLVIPNNTKPLDKKLFENFPPKIKSDLSNKGVVDSILSTKMDLYDASSACFNALFNSNNSSSSAQIASRYVNFPLVNSLNTAYQLFDIKNGEGSIKDAQELMNKIAKAFGYNGGVLGFDDLAKDTNDDEYVYDLGHNGYVGIAYKDGEPISKVGAKVGFVYINDKINDKKFNIMKINNNESAKLTDVDKIIETIYTCSLRELQTNDNLRETIKKYSSLLKDHGFDIKNKNISNELGKILSAAAIMATSNIARSINFGSKEVSKKVNNALMLALNQKLGLLEDQKGTWQLPIVADKAQEVTANLFKSVNYSPAQYARALKDTFGIKNDFVAEVSADIAKGYDYTKAIVEQNNVKSNATYSDAVSDDAPEYFQEAVDAMQKTPTASEDSKDDTKDEKNDNLETPSVAPVVNPTQNPTESHDTKKKHFTRFPSFSGVDETKDQGQDENKPQNSDSNSEIHENKQSPNENGESENNGGNDSNNEDGNNQSNSNDNQSDKDGLKKLSVTQDRYNEINDKIKAYFDNYNYNTYANVKDEKLKNNPSFKKGYDSESKKLAKIYDSNGKRNIVALFKELGYDLIIDENASLDAQYETQGKNAARDDVRGIITEQTHKAETKQEEPYELQDYSAKDLHKLAKDFEIPTIIGATIDDNDRKQHAEFSQKILNTADILNKNCFAIENLQYKLVILDVLQKENIEFNQKNIDAIVGVLLNVERNNSQHFDERYAKYIGTKDCLYGHDIYNFITEYKNGNQSSKVKLTDEIYDGFLSSSCKDLTEYRNFLMSNMKEIYKENIKIGKVALNELINNTAFYTKEDADTIIKAVNRPITCENWFRDGKIFNKDIKGSESLNSIAVETIKEVTEQLNLAKDDKKLLTAVETISPNPNYLDYKPKNVINEVNNNSDKLDVVEGTVKETNDLNEDKLIEVEVMRAFNYMDSFVDSNKSLKDIKVDVFKIVRDDMKFHNSVVASRHMTKNLDFKQNSNESKVKTYSSENYNKLKSKYIKATLSNNKNNILAYKLELDLYDEITRRIKEMMELSPNKVQSMRNIKNYYKAIVPQANLYLKNENIELFIDKKLVELTKEYNKLQEAARIANKNQETKALTSKQNNKEVDPADKTNNLQGKKDDGKNGDSGAGQV